MVVKQIRLSNTAKDKLARLKGRFVILLRKGQFHLNKSEKVTVILRCPGIHLLENIVKFMSR